MVRKALGKGLDTILPVSDGEKRETIPQKTSREVPITLIDPNPSQPRTRMNEKGLKELSESIRQQGVIQPLVVKSAGDRFQLIAGERRLRASELAGLASVPVIIKDIDEDDLLVVALIENIQREDLNPIEEAEAYHALQQQKNLTQEELAAAVGKERSTVANALRLLKLPRYALEALTEGEISSGHARALLMLEDRPDRMKQLFNSIIANRLSVRDAENFVKKAKEADVEKQEKRKTDTAEADPFIKDAEKKLCERLSAKVAINHKPEGKGQITINYASDGELQRLFDALLSIKY